MKSKIWEVSKEELQEILNTTTSMREVCVKLGISPNGDVLRRRIKEEGLDDSFVRNNCYKNSNFASKKQDLSFYLVEHSKCTRVHLKNRLIKEGLLEDKCSECGLMGIWNNKPIILQLDHKNGIGDDNRIDNLRLLCPNCHSQTETYAGRKNRKPKVERVIDTHRKTWASREELEELLWKESTTKIAKRFNVSDKAVTYWVKKYNLKKPGRGYWSSNKN